MNVVKNQDRALIEAYISILLFGLLASEVWWPDAQYSRTIFSGILAVYGGYTIYRLWQNAVNNRIALRECSLYPFRFFERQLLYTMIFLYILTAASLPLSIILWFATPVPYYSAFIALFISVVNLTIIVSLEYKKKVGLYGISIDRVSMRVATSDFSYLIPWSAICNITADQEFLYLGTDKKGLPSPIKLDLSMFTVKDKSNLYRELGLRGVQLGVD